tara:strand:+ start:898 stop:1077 length:180 start_codon:yes stop_codon:yes gene_type:complete
MRSIRPFLIGEKQTPIPVASMITVVRDYDGYTRIQTTIRKQPFITSLTPDEVMDMRNGG